jgi:hypothetical protein
MEYPTNQAFSVKFTTLDQATNWAKRKRNFGGCFLPCEGGFICYWLPKNHSAIEHFSW